MDTDRKDWEILVETGEALPGSGLAAQSAQMRAQGQLPEDLSDAPLIIDTDIGGDADDALALVAAATSIPQLALVITSDETGPAVGPGQRARFARALLDSLGRQDVAVAAGTSHGDTRYYCVDGLIPASVEAQSSDVLAAVRAVCASTPGPVAWVGMGPLSTLAELTTHAPELAGRLRVTQMGGALNYRRPERAEHNIRMDISAAHTVAAAIDGGVLPTPKFVISDVTFTPELEIDAASPVYQALAASPHPWARMVVANMDQFFERFYPATLMHDPLTLAAALELPFVDFDQFSIELDDIGRMTSTDKGGVRVWLSRHADYPAFMTWLSDRLISAASAGAPAPTRAVR